MEGKGDNMKHELVSNDNIYYDLVNNFKQFHIHNSESVYVKLFEIIY